MNIIKEVINPRIDTVEKLTGDGLSLAVVTGAMLDMLPAIAAVLTILWTAIRIYETDTVQNWFSKKNK